MTGTPWVEPSSRLPLRYGSYRARYLIGIGSVFVGGIGMQFASAYTLGILLSGFLMSVAGWIVLPAPGWRRSLAVGPAIFGVASLLNGAESGGLVALSLGAWLLVRMRPLRSYLVAAAPVVASILLARYFPQYGWGVVVGAMMGSVVVASAWLARVLAARPFAVGGANAQRKPRKVPLK